MLSDSNICEIPADVLERTRSKVIEHFRNEMDLEASPELIEDSLREWFDQRVDLVIEEMPEMLTRPGSDELREFERIVAAKQAARMTHPAAAAAASVERAAEAEHPMFQGYRPFSAERLTAMMAYLSQKSSDVYKTKLNKLLFYADLTAYYLTGQGMSGARYVNLPYGPVPDGFNDILEAGADAGTIELTPIAEKGPGVLRIAPGKAASKSFETLSETDRHVLDWVAENYGSLSTAEITDLSHEESAYKFTRPNEPISYRYANLLKTLPPPNKNSN